MVELTDPSIISKIAGNLCRRDWLNFHTVCQSWYRPRLEIHLYHFQLCRSRALFFDDHLELKYVLQRNDLILLAWFLRNNRHRIKDSFYFDATAQQQNTAPHLANEMIEFDKYEPIVAKKAREQVALLADDEILVFFKNLLKRTDYKLPFCQELATRLAIPWKENDRVFSILSNILRKLKSTFTDLEFITVLDITLGL